MINKFIRNLAFLEKRLRMSFYFEKFSWFNENMAFYFKAQIFAMIKACNILIV